MQETKTFLYRSFLIFSVGLVSEGLICLGLLLAKQEGWRLLSVLASPM
jgi:hypothetical protein